ncbi:META domain-containing protein [Sphingomonas alpina]|uniref:META domain-containing protein n=1 Tax=Sphingomonas alpina TaxID=653931 RepID=A0A7H0LNH9_9SPHN|nr:META domain-containing protein [Sphingomonas alpina]QNQ11232.1 META domain-containing protein [Sphingomonas alpina]
MKFALTLAFAVPTMLLGGTALAQRERAPLYEAVGTEPGWTLVIDRDLIRYVGDYGRTRVTASTPEPRPSFNGRRYVADRITVDITNVRCSDGMSDRVYPDKVTVTIGRRTVSGCGGRSIVAPAPAPASLLSGAWRIESVGGLPTRGPKPATVTFTGNRIGGSTGCNNFGGTYRFERGFLVAGPLMATQMGCQPGVMAQELAILGAFNQRLSISSNRGGKLVLSGRGQARLVLVPTFPGRR